MHGYIVFKQDRSDSTLSSLRAKKQNQNGSTHLLSCHPLLHLNIPGMYTSTFLRAQLDLNVFLPARVRHLFRKMCVT